jgi:chemotaxis protein MotB
MKKDRQAPIQITIKKKGHEGHHGGAWKVALADFMTAMFALFLVLWLVNQSSDVKSAIAGYFQDPLGRAKEHGSSIMPGEGAQAAGAKRALSQSEVLSLRKDKLAWVAEDIKKELSESGLMNSLEDHIEILLTDEGLHIELIEDSTGYFFEKGVSQPSPHGRKILALLGAELGVLTLPVRIEGHTDAHSFKIRKDYSNWELSADRANAARRIMTESGLPRGQIVQVNAMADRNPRVPDDPYSPGNRRVTITMLLTDENFEDEASEDVGPPVEQDAATTAPADSTDSAVEKPRGPIEEGEGDAPEVG